MLILRRVCLILFTSFGYDGKVEVEVSLLLQGGSTNIPADMGDFAGFCFAPFRYFVCRHLHPLLH